MVVVECVQAVAPPTHDAAPEDGEARSGYLLHAAQRGAVCGASAAVLAVPAARRRPSSEAGVARPGSSLPRPRGFSPGARPGARAVYSADNRGAEDSEGLGVGDGVVGPGAYAGPLCLTVCHASGRRPLARLLPTISSSAAPVGAESYLQVFGVSRPRG